MLIRRFLENPETGCDVANNQAIIRDEERRERKGKRGENRENNGEKILRNYGRSTNFYSYQSWENYNT